MRERKKVILVCEAESFVQSIVCSRFNYFTGLQTVSCATMDDVIEYMITHPKPDALLINEAAMCGDVTKRLVDARGDKTGLHGGLFLLLEMAKKNNLPPLVFLTTAQDDRNIVGYREEFEAICEQIGQGNVFFLPHENLVGDIATRMGL